MLDIMCFMQCQVFYFIQITEMSEKKDPSNQQQKANAEDSKRKKKKKEDFHFGKLLGEGSYSTVGT